MALHPESTRRRRSLLSAALIASLCCPVVAEGNPAQERVAARYRQMLMANPTEGTALDRLWKMAEASRSTDALLAEFDAKADQGDFSGLMIHGLLLRRKGDNAAAQKRFTQAAEAKPDSALPPLALAETLEGEPRAEALERAVGLLPASSPLLPGLLQKTGDAWIALQRADRAGAAWERMVALDPSNIALRQRLAEAYVAADAADRAAPHYDYLEKNGDPATRAGALRSLAALHQGKGDTAEAVALLERALALTSADNWLRRDLILQIIRYSREAGSTAQLISRWEASAEAAPQSVTAWQQLAALYHAEAEPEKERKALERLLALQPENAPLKRDLARLLVKLNDLPAAAPLLDDLLKAQPVHRPDADLIFDRATLDVLLGETEAAQTRLEALLETANEETRPALLSRALAFYHEHRMLTALETTLKRAGGDPVELALFLFNAHRPEEAREALARIGKAGTPPEETADALNAAADRLKQAGENAAALELLQQATALQPDSRDRQMALGELAVSFGGERKQLAVEAFTKAVALSKDDAARIEADHRLFRAYEQLPDPQVAPQRTLRTAAGKAMEALLSAPAPAPSPVPEKGEALNAMIRKMETEAAADATNFSRWFRLAHWLFWKRDFPGARSALQKAVALEPKHRTALELGASIAQADADPTEAVQWFKRLITAYPEEANLWRKKVALIQLQNGEPDDGITILQELAAEGDATALADLARGYQQADRWYDALETWQKLYASARYAQRYDLLQPLIRVMQRLEMHPRAADTLWNAYEEQSDPALRASILADLIVQCRSRNTFPWLLEKLKGRTEKPGTSADLQAWATALKAAGRADESYAALKAASAASPDRASAEGELAKEAEELSDYAQAAAHQKQRLMFLASPSAEEWERLAALQEAALDYAEADESHRQLVRRFPRNTTILLKAAGYFEKWGQPKEAVEVYQQIVGFDPMALAAAAGVVRLSSDPAQAAAAARQLLEHSRAEKEEEELILPETSAMIGNNLRALFHVISSTAVTSGGMPVPPSAKVLVFNERGFGSTTKEWRLEAIRALARQVSDKERGAWTKQWRDSKTASVSEALWALYYARADREMMEYLIAQAAKSPSAPAHRAAVIWMGLTCEAWPELGTWLWGPGRATVDYENFRSLFGLWAQFGRPFDSEALFRKAPVAQVWASAEVLAGKERLRDAATIGKGLMEKLPAPVTQLGARACLDLSYWLLTIGDQETAETLLRQVASTPADALDMPAFAAQRILYRMLSPLERERWSAGLLQQNGSPIFTAYTTLLIRALEGQPEPMKQAAERLARLGSGTLSDTPSIDRAWNAVLRAGIQLEEWGLTDAAIYLWETALSDPASLHLQGDRVRVYTGELNRRLVIAQLARADFHDATVLLETLPERFSLAELQQIAAQLEGAGHRLAAAQVNEAMVKKEPRMPLTQLVRAYRAAGEESQLRTLVEEWINSDRREPGSAPIILETLAQWDRPRAMKLAAEIASSIDGHQPALLQLLAQWQLKSEDWQAAATTYQRLLGIEPHNPALPIGLATAQVALGFEEEALDQLAKAPGKNPVLELKRLEIALKLKRLPLARQIAGDLITLPTWEPITQAGRLFVDAGQWQEGAALLSAGVDRAEAAGRSRGAFEIQRALLLQMGPRFSKETGERWLRRLNRLAKGWPDLISAAVEAGRDSRIAPMKDQIAMLSALWAKGAGEPVTGAWLFSHLLDTTIPPDEVLNELLSNPETSAVLLRWMRTRAQESKKPEYCIPIDKVLIDRYPESTDDLLNAVRTLHTLGKNREALRLLESGLPRLLFSSSSLSGEFALLAYDLGEPAMARQLFEEAIRADEGARATAVYLGYARLLMTDGDFPGTKRILRQAFRNPANRDAATVVDYLRRSGRDHPELLPAELRDLNLRPAIKAEVERLLSAAPEGKPATPPATGEAAARSTR